MSGTNIISGFQITNNLNITDGNLVLQTNGSNVNGPSLDLTGTMVIGNVTETTSNNSKLKVSNQDLATIELISKQQPSNSTATTTSLKNDQGILKFNVENSTRNVKYIFDVSDNLGVGMVSNIESGDERIGFVLGTTEVININNGIGSNGKINMENYDNPHLFYNYHNLPENRFLGFAGTNIQFLTANETDLSLNELNPRMIINTSGNIGINTLNPGVSLNVNDNDGIKLPNGTTAQRPTTSSTNLSDISGIIRFNTDLQKCEVYQNTWVPLGQTTSLDGTTRIESTNTEGIELKINDITRMKLHDSSSRIDLSGNVVVQNANNDGIIFTVDGSSNFVGNVVVQNANNDGIIFTVDGSSNFVGNVGIGTDNPILNLDVSGTRIGRCIRTGDVHSESHRNSFKIGRFDGNNAENFCGLELKVDTATNMGFGSNNQSAIIFKTWGNGYGNSTEVMRINSNSNVGIGTNSPAAKLDIEVTNNSSALYIGESSTRKFGLKVKSGSNDTLVFSSEYTGYLADDILTLKTNGNVGIGTDSPTGILSIKCSTSTSTANDTQWNGVKGLRIERNTGSSSDTNSWEIVNGHHNSLLFRNINNYGSVVSATSNTLILDDNGCVGIGKLSPVHKLDVDGSIRTSLYVTTEDFIAFGTSASGGSNRHGYIGRANKSVNDKITLRAESDDLHILTDSTDNVIIQEGGGKVGIGMTPGHKLDVNGNIRVGVGGGGENAIFFRGNTGDTSDSMCVIENRIYGGSSSNGEASELLLFKGNDIAGSSGPDRIRLRAAEILLDTYSSATTARDTENIRLKIDQNGNTICGKINLAYNNEINCTYSGGNTLYLNYNSGNVNLANHGGSTYCGGTISTTGYNVRGSGWVYWSSHGNKGWYMQDSTWIRTLSNASIWAGTGNIATSGRIGVGTSTPGYPLSVYGSVTGSSSSTGYFSPSNYRDINSIGNVMYRLAASNISISVYTQHYIITKGLVQQSDKRIKENIRDVSDNYALQLLRDISCVYYEYKDKIDRGFDSTIGFIAQQVREHMPMAVSTKKDFIPNELRVIENPQWTTLTDSSGNNTFKLTINDLSDNSGNILYRFYVSNEPSGNDECKKEVYSLENEPNSFIFDKKYNNVFLHGKQVDDLHILNKNKLFTLNFSATQEIDRIQQEEKTKLNQANAKIADLENKNNVLTSKIADLENQMYEIKQLLAAANN